MRVRGGDVVAELRKWARGGTVAFASLLVYSSVYASLAQISRLDAVSISVIAYSTAMAVSFVGHKYVTFRVSGNLRSQLLRFISIHLLCLFTTVVITDLVVDQLHWPYGVAIVLVDIIIPVLSFVALKFVVFENRAVHLSKRI